MRQIISPGEEPPLALVDLVPVPGKIIAGKIGDGYYIMVSDGSYLVGSGDSGWVLSEIGGDRSYETNSRSQTGVLRNVFARATVPVKMFQFGSIEEFTYWLLNEVDGPDE